MEDALKQKQEAGMAIGEAVSRGFALVWQTVLAHKAETVCTALLIMLPVNLFASISRKSITNDEIVHIPAGYYHLVAGEFQLNNEHPPLIKMWAALPLLFIQPNEANENANHAPGNYSQETWRYLETFWPANRDRIETIYFWTRAMMVLLTLALGILIFVYCRDLFGPRAAVLAVLLYTLEPTVLAHGRIVHTDLPAALAYLFFFFALRRYLNQRTVKRALLLGLATGLGLVTKFSMIVLLPVLVVTAAGLLLIPRWRKDRKQILIQATVVACCILFVVNAAYYFKRPPVLPEDVKWVRQNSQPTFDRWMTLFSVGSRILPTYYLFGQYNVALHNREGHPTSLLGQYSRQGWWYYFPVAFAIKTSIPFLIISLAALVWAAWRLIKWREKHFLWVLLPLAIYAAMSMSSNINIGIRHFLPAYPFLFVAAGALLERMLRIRYPRHLSIVLVVILISWMAIEALRTFPDYVPYMNQLARNHPRWWYLSDSNVEWGDDANALAQYLHARGETDVSGAVSGGWGTLAFYGIKYHEVFPKPGRKIPNTRYVAIGASFLNGSTIAVDADEKGQLLSEEQRINYLAKYRDRSPEAVFGNSIYLYRVQD